MSCWGSRTAVPPPSSASEPRLRHSVTLEWDAVNDNGSPVTDYNVIRWSSAAEGGIESSVHTTETSATFGGLYDGIFYFTVEATNLAGTGPRKRAANLGDRRRNRAIGAVRRPHVGRRLDSKN